MQYRTLTGLLAASSLVLLSGETPASLIAPMSLTELTDSAGRVVVGEVLSVQSQWDRGHRTIFTKIEIQVVESWKGQTPQGGRLTVFQPGGSVGDIEMRVHGLRAFEVGERAVLFLSAGEQPYTVGLGQGHRRLSFDDSRRSWMVDRGDRSAAYRAPSEVNRSAPRSRLTPEDGIVSLDDLRRTVRALVRR